MNVENLKVMAIIVSFNDSIALLKTLNAIIDQVDFIFIIDNGSKEEHIIELKKILLKKVICVFLKENKGIAFALNKGVKYALENNYSYILTMDQDSIADSKMVECLKKSINSNEKIMVAGPAFKKNHFKKDFSYKETLITSGNLIKSKVFNEICIYDESLFIDSVDFDFSLKIINAGYLLVQSNNAILNHRLGKKISFNLLGFSYSYTSHNPFRRYYIFRNHIILVKRYFFTNNFFILKKTIYLFIALLEILIFDKSKKLNLSAIFAGVKDGVFSKKIQ
jgi:rhamnosyltransferase